MVKVRVRVRADSRQARIPIGGRRSTVRVQRRLEGGSTMSPFGGAGVPGRSRADGEQERGAQRERRATRTARNLGACSWQKAVQRQRATAKAVVAQVSIGALARCVRATRLPSGFGAIIAQSE